MGFVDFHVRESIHAALAERWKNFRGKSDQRVFVELLISPDILFMRNTRPAQRPRINVDKTSKVGRSKNLASIFKGKSKAFDKAGCSKD